MSAARAGWTAGFLLALALICPAAYGAPDGSGIVDRALAHRSQACCIYQELIMILSDRSGEHGLRKLRWYERREADGSRRLLLVFVAPVDVRGAAVLVTRDAQGAAQGEFYLPALGKPLGLVAGSAGATPLVGSDFKLADLLMEAPRGFVFVRENDAEINRSMHYVVRATPADAAARRAGGGMRRYFVHKSDFFLVRIDFHDARGRLARRHTFRDPKQVDNGIWQADMVLAEDFGERHRTLMKVERRVFSPEYVPPEIFSRQWLVEQRYLLVGGDSPFGP